MDFLTEFFDKNDLLTVLVIIVLTILANVFFIIFSYFLVDYIKDGFKKNFSLILICLCVMFSSEFIVFVALKFEIFKLF
jgi:hypothetical protein